MPSRHVALVLAGFVVLGGCSSEIFTTALTDGGSDAAAGPSDGATDGGTQVLFDAPLDGNEDDTIAGLPGLELWLRAHDLSAPTVLGWPDHSGKGRNAALLGGQCTPPIFHVSASGRPAVVFDGTACLGLASGVADFAGGVSIFVVAETHPQNADGLAAFLRMSGTGSTATIQFGRDSTDTLKYVTTNVSATPDPIGRQTGVIDGSWHLYELVQGAGVENQPAPVAIYRDGAPLNTGTVNVPANLARAFNTVGGRANGSFLTADVGEIILASRAVTEAQRRLIEGALQRKWKL